MEALRVNQGGSGGQLSSDALVCIDPHEDPSLRILREYLFNATFIVAANVLAGRQLSDIGLAHLRDCTEVPLVTYHLVDKTWRVRKQSNYWRLQAFPPR